MFLIKASDRLSKTLMVISALWALALCFLILADVVGRGLLGRPFNGMTEIVSNSIVIIVFLGAGFAVRSRSMLHADFLVDALPPRIGKAGLTVGYLLGCIFFLIIARGAFWPMIDSFVNWEFDGEGAIHVPVFPTRLVIVTGSVLCALNYVILAWMTLTDVRDESFGEPSSAV